MKTCDNAICTEKYNNLLDAYDALKTEHNVLENRLQEYEEIKNKYKDALNDMVTVLQTDQVDCEDIVNILDDVGFSI